jgi:hypothetical protein
VKRDAPVQIPPFNRKPEQEASEQQENHRVGERRRRGADIGDAK